VALILVAMIEAGFSVTLRIDAESTLRLENGPHVAEAVTRDRYFRLYHFPGMFEGKTAEDLRRMRVAPGRGTGPYFGDDGGDPARAVPGGSPDDIIAGFVTMALRGEREFPGSWFAAAGGSFPVLPTGKTAAGGAVVDPTMKVRHNRVVAPAEFGATAGLLRRWLDALERAEALAPRFFSPVNEPDASWKGGPDSALDHARFVREMAVQLRDARPGVGVSGPCTAWPYPGDQWERWRPTGWERSLIEQAGDVVGAYDFHLYTKELWAYGPESPGYQQERKQQTANLFASLSRGHRETMEFGLAEVLLDLVQALHQAKWRSPSPPVIISEFGRQGITPQLGPWANDYLFALYGGTVTRLWMVLMDRPEVALTVPFILPESDAGYGPRRGQALANRPGASWELQTTPLRDYVAFFRDFSGERLPVAWRDAAPELARGLFAIGCRSGGELLVLLHNATPDAQTVTLDLPGSWPEGVTVARMGWSGPVPADHRSPNPPGADWRRDLEAGDGLAEPAAVLAGEETVILRIPWQAEVRRRQVVRRYYASEALLTLGDGQPARMHFTLKEEMLAGAKGAELVLGYAAPRGPTRRGGSLAVMVAGWGGPVSISLGLSSGWRQVAVPVRVAVPLAGLVPGLWCVEVTDSEGTLAPGSRIVAARLELTHEEPVGSLP
jgi:hypothetical protein